MPLKKKGFTILELLICMLIFSLILIGIASAVSKVGKVTSYSYTDISTRDSQNKLFNDFNIAVHSLLSNKDDDYKKVTNAGVIVDDITSKEEIVIDGILYQKVNANTITLYTKGDTQKYILSFARDAIQDRAPTQISGTLHVETFKFDYDFSGEITGEKIKKESITPCIMFSSAGEINCESNIEILMTEDNMLSRITINYVLPKIDYQIKQAQITQTCQQEVKVECH